MSEDITKKYFYWIDNLKVCLIFLVVLGHLPTNFNPYIYQFHIPIFFALSGFLYKPKTKKDECKYIYKRLLLPYIIISCICGLFLLLKDNNANSSNIFLGILFGDNIVNSQIYSPCVPMWFVIALIWMRIMSSISMKYSLLFTLCFLLILKIKIITSIPFLSIDSALLAYPFFYFGYYLKNQINKVTLSKKQIIILFIINIICNIFIANLNGFVDISNCKYGQYLTIFYMWELICSYSFIIFFKKCLDINGGNIMYTLNQGMLIIVGFHLIISYTLFRLLEGIIKDINIYSIIITIITFIILIPFILIIVKVCPVMIGQKTR